MKLSVNEAKLTALWVGTVLLFNWVLILKFAFGREMGLLRNGPLAANENVSRKWPLARDVRVKWLLTEAGPFTEYTLEMQKKKCLLGFGYTVVLVML